MWHPKAMNDDGFTLVELLVTMVIIGTVLIALIGVQVSAMRTIALSKQRQQAVALANQTMEQLRALPYDTVRGGLNSSDVGGDPNISAGRFRPAYSGAIDEALVTSANLAGAPLNPHIQSIKVGGTRFDVRVYVSLVVTADPTAGYWLTSIATWTTSVTSNRPKTVVVRSQLFSPAGCLSTATHPFSGPCQAFLYGTSGTTPGSITLQAVDPSSPVLFSGVDLQGATLSLPKLSATAQVEQSLSAQGKATTSGVQAATSTGQQTVGSQSATSAADNDPGTGAVSPTSSNSASQSGSSQLTFGSGSNALGLLAAPSDTATSTSTASAVTADNCQSLAGTALITNNVCTSSAVTPGGSLSVGYRGLSLASIGPGAQSRAFAARFTASGGALCPAANGAGCMSAGTTQNEGTASVGAGLPGVPPGFSSMVSLSAYSARATSESGLGAASPAYTASRTGSLSYWGADLQQRSVTLSPTTSLASIPLGNASSTSGGTGNQLLIAMSGTLLVQPQTVTSTGTAPCLVAACTVTVTVPSVTALVTFSISVAGTQVANFVLRMDLGSALAKTTYKAAPSG